MQNNNWNRHTQFIHFIFQVHNIINNLTAWICALRSQITKLMGPTWGPSGSCRPQTGPMLSPWTFLSGVPCLYNAWPLVYKATLWRKRGGQYLPHNNRFINYYNLHWFWSKQNCTSEITYLNIRSNSKPQYVIPNCKLESKSESYIFS